VEAMTNIKTPEIIDNKTINKGTAHDNDGLREKVQMIIAIGHERMAIVFIVTINQLIIDY
jgi:hypothetical protein